MAATNVQAIAGVNAGRDTLLTTVYPSNAATGIGKFLGNLYESIPVRICGLKVSNLLFTLPTAPLAVLQYALLKLFGARYEVTSTAVRMMTSLGVRTLKDVPFSDIDSVEIEQLAGQEFYKASDILLMAGNGEVLMRLEGIPRADVLRETIVKAQDAQSLVAASLATIEGRS